MNIKNIICKECHNQFEPFLTHMRGTFGHSCPFCGASNTYEQQLKALVTMLILVMKIK